MQKLNENINAALKRQPWQAFFSDFASVVLNGAAAAASGAPFGVLYDPPAVSDALGLKGAGVKANVAGFGIAATGLVASYALSALAKKVEAQYGAGQQASVKKFKEGVLEDSHIIAKALEDAARQSPSEFTKLRDEFANALKSIEKVDIQNASVKQLTKALHGYNEEVKKEIPQNIMQRHMKSAFQVTSF